MAQHASPAHSRPAGWARRIGLAAWLLAVPAAGHAQTQQDLTAAADARRAAADGRLNADYTRLMAKLSPDGKAALRTAQRSWLQFRDQECAFETMGSAGGSIHPMVVAECETRLTLARTADLDAQLNCQEGDVACGGQ